VGSTEQPLAVVLSGGGCKTFWSLGAMQRIQAALPPVTEWAGVSAGSAMAAACACDRASQTLDYFCERTAANRSNVYPLHVLGSRPVFPHEQIYRATILHALADGGFEALKSAAPLRILLAHFTSGASPIKTVFGAVMAYRQRKKRHILHGPDEPHPGFGVQYVTAQDCASSNELADFILASSCTPPITAVQTIDGRSYGDGALVDHAPVRALSPEARESKVLVFSTMHIPRHALPVVDNRLYFAPSRPIPISIWDYASPDKVKQAHALGASDAERFLPLLDAFL
jgi:predicted acylesterase/phospholipase RssA